MSISKVRNPLAKTLFIVGSLVAVWIAIGIAAYSLALKKYADEKMTALKSPAEPIPTRTERMQGKLELFSIGFPRTKGVKFKIVDQPREFRIENDQIGTEKSWEDLRTLAQKGASVAVEYLSDSGEVKQFIINPGTVFEKRVLVSTPPKDPLVQISKIRNEANGYLLFLGILVALIGILISKKKLQPWVRKFRERRFYKATS